MTTDPLSAVVSAGSPPLEEEPVAGPSKPRRRTSVRLLSEVSSSSAPAEGIPSSTEVDTSITQAKPQLYSRRNRVTSESGSEQQLERESTIASEPGGQEAVRPRLKSRHVPEVAQEPGPQSNEKGHSAETQPIQQKRGRGRPRKHPLPQGERENLQARSSKRARVQSVTDNETTPSNRLVSYW